MPRLPVWAAALFSSTLLAAPAAAQTGGGLYEPFAEPAPTEQVRRFIDDLPGAGAERAAALSDEEIERGAAVSGGGLRDRGGAASARAGLRGDRDMLDGWPLALAAIAAAALAGTLLAGLPRSVLRRPA